MMFRSSLALLALTVPGIAVAQTQEPPPPPVESMPTAAEQAPPAVGPPKKGLPLSAVYDGGFTVRSDDGSFELKINGILQARYEIINAPTPTAEDPDETTTDSRFVLPRSRIGLSGYVWKNTQFKVEFSFSDGGNTRLRDFYVNQLLFDGMLQLRAGQWKRPFNRNEIVSDFATSFLEKAITNTFGSRDLGIGIGNGHDKSPNGLEWVVALFNGQGDATRYPVTCTGTPPVCTVGSPTNTPSGNFRPELQARVGYNYGGIKGYSEADLEGGPLRFAAAGSIRLRNLSDTDANPLGFDVDLDAVVKLMGLDVWGAFFIIKNKDVDPQYAFHLQAGYMVLPKTLNVSARFAMFPLAAPDDGEDQEYNQEVRAAVSWFFSKSHAYKWYSDFGFTKTTVEDSDPTWVVRTGAQLIF